MKSKIKNREKVFIGLSGGVDSSVSAALLKKEGYDVTGVFILGWTPDFMPCSQKEDRIDAMRVCAKLEIPFITLDLEKEYKKEVVDYMIREYKAGRTPNPDVMCNKHIKFGAFFDWAIANGADFVATGHYAWIRKILRPDYRTPPLRKEDLNLPFLKGVPSLRGEGFIYELLTALDSSKDQSYFLWTLTQKQLSRTLFPVGNLIKKTEVRKLAEEFGLPTAEKKDSQGLCFMGKIDVKEFLKNFIKPKKGKVLLAPSEVGGDENGKEIGEHDGAFMFTIGERHNFIITKKGANDLPYYVVAKDVKKNTITVSHKSPEGKLALAGKEAVIGDVSWTAGEPDFSKKYSARIRYRQPLQSCKLTKFESPSPLRRGEKPVLRQRGVEENTSPFLADSDSLQELSTLSSSQIRPERVLQGSKSSPFTPSTEGERGTLCHIFFDTPQNAITPGQSLVIYDGEACVGGGIIE